MNDTLRRVFFSKINMIPVQKPLKITASRHNAAGIFAITAKHKDIARYAEQ